MLENKVHYIEYLIKFAEHNHLTLDEAAANNIVQTVKEVYMGTRIIDPMKKDELITALNKLPLYYIDQLANWENSPLAVIIEDGKVADIQEVEHE